MIIELPNQSAIESSIIMAVRWWPSDETVNARVGIDMKSDDRYGYGRSPSMVVYCESDEEARTLSRRVIDEWKQGAEQKAA